MTTAGYPSEILIEPLDRSSAMRVVRVPGSKSLTNRALVVAALAEGTEHPARSTRLRGHAGDGRGLADDRHRGRARCGSAVITVQGCSGVIPSREASLYVANSGTSLRFLTAMLGHGTGNVSPGRQPAHAAAAHLRLAGRAQRPGGRAESDLGTGCPPVTIEANGPRRRRCVRRGRRLEPVLERAS